MLKNWKALLGGGEASPSASNASGSQTSRDPGLFTTGRGPETVQKRHSAGLDQFFFSLRDQEGLSILDLAGASQANITFITNMGHRLYSDDVMRSLEASFGGAGDFFENQADPERVKQFMSAALDFPPETFGAPWCGTRFSSSRRRYCMTPLSRSTTSCNPARACSRSSMRTRRSKRLRFMAIASQIRKR